MTVPSLHLEPLLEAVEVLRRSVPLGTFTSAAAHTAIDDVERAGWALETHCDRLANDLTEANREADDLRRQLQTLGAHPDERRAA